MPDALLGKGIPASERPGSCSVPVLESGNVYLADASEVPEPSACEAGSGKGLRTDGGQ